MPDEFSYTFRQHSIVLTRKEEGADWYIQVRDPRGCYAYDGWWRNSAGRSLKDALHEAKVGAALIPAPKPMAPTAATPHGVAVAPATSRTDIEWLRLPEVFGKFVDYAKRPTDDNALRIIRACAERAAGVPPSDGGQQG